eukprot:504870_1
MKFDNFVQKVLDIINDCEYTRIASRRTIESVSALGTWLWCTIIIAFIIYVFIKRLFNQISSPHPLSSLNIHSKIEKLLQMDIRSQQELSESKVLILLNEYQKSLLHEQKLSENETKNLKCHKMSQCTMFKRNYRDRRKCKNDISINGSENERKDIDAKAVALQQIYDKIHCYFYHHLDKLDLNYSISTKNKTIKHETKTIRNRMNNKYNQLYLDTKNTFLFGTEFKYVDINENKQADKLHTHMDQSGNNYSGNVAFYKVAPKYTSLKEDMISNEITTLSIQQFANEYNKALIHHTSYIKRKHYPLISVHHLLALMFYCNFDNLQYEFSRTYRENVDKHSNFYHLGKL